MSAVQLAYDPEGLPASWSGDWALLAPVVEQGWCDNSWAVSAAAVAMAAAVIFFHGHWGALSPSANS